MMSERWQRSKELFLRALEQPLATRRSFLQERCSDPELLGELLELLDAHEKDSEFLQTPWGDPPANMGNDSLIGQKIGAFTIERLIGRGGAGAVYEASQTNPVRRVAVKFLRQDVPMLPTILKRFENESQILAQLSHRGIAHVYGAGKINCGDVVQPWFAMELIDGPNLSEKLREVHLKRDEKLKLFLKICDAVSCAHAGGIVHRDLKPANILIQQTASAGSALDALQPKVLDFGIAMMVVSDDLKSTLLTTGSDILGTIDYFSPEQVIRGQEAVDQRCDVYALGLILFEMLTGRLPHYRRSNSLVQVIGNIENEGKLRLREIDSGFSRELDVVVEKATRSQASRRYRSVDEFAADVRRLLANEPIQARPPSYWYIGSKFLMRNRLLFAGVATTILALSIGLMLYANEAVVARNAAVAANYEAEKAVAVSSFITNDFLTKLLVASRNPDPDDPQAVEKIVDESAGQIESMFLDKPTIHAAICNEVGTIYLNIGAAPKAVQQYERALQLWESELGAVHADTLKAVNNLALAQMSSGGHDSTESLLRRAVDGRILTLGKSHLATLQSMNNLADWLRRRDQLGEAETLFVEALRLQREFLGETDQTTMITSANLGSLYLSQDKVEEALNLHRATYQSAARILGENHRTTLQAGVRLAQTFDRADRYDEALEALEPVLGYYLKMSSSTPELAIVPLRLKSRILRHSKNFDAAEEVLDIASEIASKDPEKMRRGLRKIEEDRRRIARDRSRSE